MGGRTSGTWAKGSGIPAGGDGWGGQAKGAGHTGAGPGRPEGMKDGEGKAARLADLGAAHIASVMQVWVDVMGDVNAPPMARIAAAEKIADRVEGKAVATTVSANVNADENLSPAELAAAIARARREVAALGGDPGEAEGGE